VAQTRRRRRTKHRGNAAGVIESRGRTGRKPTAAEKRGAASAARKKDTVKDRRDRPPTWRGAFDRAMIAAVLLLVLAILLHVGAAVVLPLRAARVHAHQLLHRPLDLQAQAARESAARRRAEPEGVSALVARRAPAHSASERAVERLA